MSRDGDLRASDADREQAIEMLRSAAGEGRLDADELDERVQRALRARTYGELAATVIDLPASDDPAVRGRRRGDRRGRGSGDTPVWAAARPGRGHRPGGNSRGRRAGGWMWRTLRANPILLIVALPWIAVMGMVAVAFMMSWMVVLGMALLLGGRSREIMTHRSMLWRHGHSYGRGRRGAWTLSWGGPAQRHRG